MLKVYRIADHVPANGTVMHAEPTRAAVLSSHSTIFAWTLLYYGFFPRSSKLVFRQINLEVRTSMHMSEAEPLLPGSL